jgi:hypothetical protein
MQLPFTKEQFFDLFAAYNAVCGRPWARFGSRQWW